MARRSVPPPRPATAFHDFADPRPVLTVRAGETIKGRPGSVVRYYPAPNSTADETAIEVQRLRERGAVAVRVQPQETAKRNVAEGRQTEEELTKQIPVREALVEACGNVRGIDAKQLEEFVLGIADEVSL